MLPAAQISRIDSIVRTVMREEHIAGCSVGIARRGAIVLLKGYGLRDVASHRAADGYTIYRAGSIAKQFTAAAVLRLADRNAISLSAPLGSYLPGMGTASSVTIAQLLAQQSGIPSYTDPGATFASAIAAPLEFKPGTSWAYSNTNYLLLGKVLESQTHRPYSSILQQEIIAPLGLRSTGYDIPAFASNVAQGYRYEGGRYVAAGDDRSAAEYAAAAGALATNAVDLLHWLEALRSGSVVSSAAYASMTHHAHLSDETATGYGYGFFVSNWYGWQVAEHPGYIDGFSADDALVLDDGLEIAVLCNADRVPLAPLSESIVAILDSPKDANMYADRPRPPENEDPRITATVRTLFLQLQHGTIDRTRLSSKLSQSLSESSLQSGAPALARLGDPQLVEFIERTRQNALTYDKYRLTFGAQKYWMTLGYGKDGKIDALTLTPDDD